MGAYAGQQLTLLAFKGEQIQLTLSGSDFAGQIEAHCRDAVYQPFPEIEFIG